MPISSVGTYYEYSVNSDSSASSEMDKDAFLNLMVTELKYQDPLDPMDNTEYVAQLAQFSSLEQLYTVNEQLETDAYLTQSMHNSIVSSVIGKDILAQSDSVIWSGSGEKEVEFTLAEDASDVTVSIYTEDGSLVKTIDLDYQNAGNVTATWDGTNLGGGTVSEGVYYMDVAAYNDSGEKVDFVPVFRGTVTGLRYNDGTPTFMVGDAEISISEVLEIVAAEESEENTDTES